MTGDVSHSTSKSQATDGKTGWRGEGEDRTGVQAPSPSCKVPPRVSQPS